MQDLFDLTRREFGYKGAPDLHTREVRLTRNRARRRTHGIGYAEDRKPQPKAEQPIQASVDYSPLLIHFRRHAR